MDNINLLIILQEFCVSSTISNPHFSYKLHTLLAVICQFFLFYTLFMEEIESLKYNTLIRIYVKTICIHQFSDST
jgi:hypothetical protein